MSNHTLTATTAALSTTTSGLHNLDEYAATAELPECVAPVQPSLIFPHIRYAKGVLVVSGKKPTKYTGWHIQTEQSAELDALLESQSIQPVRVRHHSGNEETYWSLDTIKGYILCNAVPGSYGPLSWQTGIPYVWNQYAGTYAYGSQLQCLFFMKGLLELGYTQPLVLSFSRTVTEHFVNKVLRRQEALIEAIRKALRKRQKPAALGFYAYWLELSKGTEEVTTKGGGSYFPPMTAIPASLTADYVWEHQTPIEHLAIIESFLPTMLQWAEVTSRRLQEPSRVNGNSNGTNTEPEPPVE